MNCAQELQGGERPMLPRDPSFVFVTSLNHFGGVNGNATNIADQVSTVQWFLTNCTTQVVTGPSGLAEPTLAIATGHATSPASFTGFGFGAGLYTVDCYWKPASIVGIQCLWDNRGGGNPDGIGMYASVSGAGKLVLTNDVAVIGTGTTVMVPGTWYHLQVCRDGSNNTYGFVNGGLEFTVVDARVLKTTAGGHWGGAFSAGQDSTGNLNNARVTKGVCRNTTSFTKPPTPFADN